MDVQPEDPVSSGPKVAESNVLFEFCKVKLDGGWEKQLAPERKNTMISIRRNISLGLPFACDQTAAPTARAARPELEFR